MNFATFPVNVGSTRPLRPNARALSWLVACALGLLLLPEIGRAVPAQSTRSTRDFGQIPLTFEKNTGQTEDRFQFFSRGAGHSIYLGPAETVVAVTGTQPSAPDRSPPAPRLLRFSLLGGDNAALGHGLQPAPGRVQHILGADPREWTTQVPTFKRVQFDRVYPGIDLVFYGNQRAFEYDFVVAPGVDPKAITFQVDGADRVEIDPRGDLVLTVGAGWFRQHKPVVYQMKDGQRQDIAARFELGTSNIVRFALGSFDRNAELIIDPVLSLDYSTYLGGAKLDRAWAVAADPSGYVYVAGETLAPLKHVPAVGFQTNFGGGTKYGGDAFVAKLDPTGTNYIYFTYLGGSSLESANGIATDGQGFAYVTGFTISSNFPVYPLGGAFQTNISGTNLAGYNVPNADVFVTKLNPVGMPVYSTYLGGEGADGGAAIAVDTNGSAYVTGYTLSAFDYRVTNEVHTLTCTNFGMTNLICGTEVIKTNFAIVRALVPTQVVTNVTRIDVTTSDPPVTNQTVSIVTTILLSSQQVNNGFPIVNPLQTNNAGAYDIFVTKFSADGSTLLYSTYLGGARSSDIGTAIRVDPAGYAVVTGTANESDFPVTNAIQSKFAGGRDAVAARLDPSGSSLVYATYLGGSLDDIAYGVAVDELGAAYVVGAESSVDFLSTPGLIRPGGVSKSSDGGTNWSGSSTGLTHTGVRALALNPVSPSTLYAGTPRGVYLTTDSGALWTSSSLDVAGLDMTALALDPNAPSVIYAGGPDGFRRSDDSGFGWLALGVGLPLADVRAIVFDPTNSSTLYVGITSGFYYSTNRGTNFVAANKGLKNKSINRLVPHPSVPGLIYAATDGGVFQTTNAGLNWKSMSAGLTANRTLGLAINPSMPETLVAGTAKGLFRTVNSGTNWAIQTNGIGKTQVNALVYDPGDSTVIYAGCTNGMFKSGDGGLNWTNLSVGLVSRDLVSIAIDPSNAALVYAGARGTNFSGGTNDAFLVKLSPDGLALEYGFTFGGTKTDEARAVAVDTNGSAFITGVTLSKNYPIVGADPDQRWQGTNSGKGDAFIAQFDAAGRSNVFSILLGGKGNDTGTGIALDGLGGIYVVGSTDSGKFVTTNAVQATHSEKLDAFLTKLRLEEPDEAPLPGFVFPVQPIVRGWWWGR